MQTQRVQGTATSCVATNGLISVVYHNTLVVEADKNRGTVKLDTGGYKTVTTKRRMMQASNQFDLGYTVFQRGFNWFVTWKGETLPFIGNTVELK